MMTTYKMREDEQIARVGRTLELLDKYQVDDKVREIYIKLSISYAIKYRMKFLLDFIMEQCMKYEI